MRGLVALRSFSFCLVRVCVRACCDRIPLDFGEGLQRGRKALRAKLGHLQQQYNYVAFEYFDDMYVDGVLVYILTVVGITQDENNTPR